MWVCWTTHHRQGGVKQPVQLQGRALVFFSSARPPFALSWFRQFSILSPILVSYSLVPSASHLSALTFSLDFLGISSWVWRAGWVGSWWVHRGDLCKTRQPLWNLQGLSLESPPATHGSTVLPFVVMLEYSTPRPTPTPASPNPVDKTLKHMQNLAAVMHQPCQK